ncbi:MAG: response regulator transcription factor [Lentisphaerae bacterium]|jgi:DNA-binding NarL/FixJ family response regulator|nr:response regulator transcription factor [Lentisphaerota bacterium]
MKKVGVIRILVIQERCLLREALIGQLNNEYWIEVCALADDVDGAAEQIEQHDPHVLLVNMGLKCDISPISIAKLKKMHGISIVALSCDKEFEDVCIGQSLRAGAAGYVSIEDSLEELICAIRFAAQGKSYWSELTNHKLTSHAFGDYDFRALSMQEYQVFSLTGCGYVTKRIAEKMGLSIKTVETYRERIRKKLGIVSADDYLYTATTYVRTVSLRNLERRGLPEVHFQLQVGRRMQFRDRVPFRKQYREFFPYPF